MTKKAAFWVVFAVASLAAVVAATRHFADAFPLVSIDLRMDRSEALRQARRLAMRDRLGPAGFRQAATFDGDAEVQTYVELEGGGKDAFARMIREGRYAPYTWRVRHFREGNTNETWIRFTPEGAPYGFAERLPESAPGPRLTAADARSIAERGAANWHVPLGEYTLVEQAQEDRPGGRLDHTLVYERPDRIRDGRYRLRLVVAGDRLVEVTRFVRVPEAFSRRYEEMRAANEAIGFAAGIAVLVLYGVGGIVIGTFLLLRHRWVLAKPAFAWGLIVAVLQVLATLNEWPLAWLHYDTALSTGTFFAQQATAVGASAVAMTIVFTLSFMAAESLSRRAFPHHPQLWRGWSREAGASRAILGRTVGGYLLVAIFFAYEVGLYLVAQRWFGWWTPSDALVHPDVLATYLPWLSAIAPSVQAGFWEECLFRAVPLAGAALIGDRLGSRRAAVAIALVVQAVVFGAGHAPYPNQPAYARPVELILPSLLFAAVYLRFGLLPGIVLHIAFDTVWFALPLFVSQTPGIWIDRTLVVVLALVPLWVVLYRKWQIGVWTDLPAALRNGAWQPPPRSEPATVRSAVRPQGAPSPRATRLLLATGCAGAIAWIATVAWLPLDAAPLRVSRSDAVARAVAAVRERSGRTDGARVLAAVDTSATDAHTFIKTVVGKSAYRALLGTYLPVPRWRVRVARFEGDVAARAEEWVVELDGAGAVSRVRHVLPEGTPGQTISADAAREVARSAAQKRFAVNPASLGEISIMPSKLPARTDWLVTFEDRSRPAPRPGQLRIAVAIGGNEVTDAWRVVHVPEDWLRAERDRRTVAGVLSALGLALSGGLLLAFATVTLVAWSHGRSPGMRIFQIFGGLALVRVLDFANGWPERIAAFTTTQSFALQGVELAVALVVGAALVPAIMSLAAGSTRLRMEPQLGARHVRLFGLGVGGTACGLLGVAALVRSGGSLSWAAFEGAGAALPVAAPVLGALFAFAARTIVLAVLFTAADRLSEGWSAHKLRAAAVLAGAGVLIGAGAPGTDLLQWLTAGLLTALLFITSYILVFRWTLASLPLAVAIVTAAGAMRGGIARPFPGALAGAVVAAAAVLLIAWRATGSAGQRAMP
jgi:hypothetical protein